MRLTVRGSYRLTSADDGRLLEQGGSLDRPVSLESAPAAGALRLLPAGGAYAVDGKSYPGSLLLLPHRRRTILVAETDLESYLPGVLTAELGASYPPAALEAQAIASRTYAIHRMNLRPSGEAWDLTDDTGSQVFAGSAGGPEQAAAIATRGVVLTWRQAVLPAYFHSTCGGHTAPAGTAFGGNTPPPLVGVPCPFCEGSRYFRWEAEFSAEELAERLPLVGALRSLDLIETRADGRPAIFRFTADRVRDIPGPEVRARLGHRRLPSSLILEERVESGRLLLTGGGWGHGVGMCQIGASRMARAGASAMDILEQYYPGADTVRHY